LDHLHLQTRHSTHKSVGNGVSKEVDHLITDDEFDHQQVVEVSAEGIRSVVTDTNRSGGGSR
jgi:hypothetical protein